MPELIKGIIAAFYMFAIMIWQLTKTLFVALWERNGTVITIAIAIAVIVFIAIRKRRK